MNLFSLLSTLSIAALPLTARAADVEVSAPTPRAAVSAELSSELGTTYVSRGRPQYTAVTDPTLLNQAQLRIEGLGPGALVIGLEAVVAVTHTDDLHGGQLGLSPKVAYAWGLSEHTTLSLGYAVGLRPYGEVLDDTHEIALGLVHERAGIVFELETALEILHRVGDYTRLGISYPIQLGPIELAPSVVGAILIEAEHALAVSDVGASVRASVEVTEAVRVLASASYAWANEDHDPSTVWGTVGVGFRM